MVNMKDKCVSISIMTVQLNILARRSIELIEEEFKLNFVEAHDDIYEVLWCRLV